jgi:hypothetical protein
MTDFQVALLGDGVNQDDDLITDTYYTLDEGVLLSIRDKDVKYSLELV